LNKIDNATQEQVDEKFAYWNEKLNPKHIFAISALHQYNLDGIMPDDFGQLFRNMPAYYDKEDLTDRSQRFFVSEIIREKIFTNYKKEIPYSTEVIVTSFKEEQSKGGPMVRISAEIIVVERESQKKYPHRNRWCHA
jgi:GTP-binding protein Era